ncbi:hypothetical protein CUR178_06627 [Leishmania enriettii]|uniref:Uncharacterized protein n=1 Tax=Leishmania enriettii TaxID=5663 RepID=A0A836H3Q0_LEIEN|nr:hypothetical protein CUR178_06627 [Leishmania enriettii]
MKICACEQLAEAAQSLHRGRVADVGDSLRRPSDTAPLPIYAAGVVYDGGGGGCGAEYAVRCGSAACGNDALGERTVAAALKDHAGALWQRNYRVCCLAAHRAFCRRVNSVAEKARSATAVMRARRRGVFAGHVQRRLCSTYAFWRAPPLC